MSIFQKIFNKFMEWLDSYYSRDYLKQIDGLKKQLKTSEDWVTTLDKETESLKTEIEAIKVELNLTNQELSTLKEPEILKPEWLVGNMKYVPVRRFVSKTKDVVIPLKKPQHCFDKSTLLYDLMKEKGLYNMEKTYENMKTVHQLISNMMTYESDLTDDWRAVSDALIFLYADCEDYAIAITSALGMAGWKEDEVFVCAGWWYPEGMSVNPNNKICHAWCIVKCDNKFYVLEGTDRRATPRLWEDWKDKYVCNLGVCNWKWGGMIENGKTYLPITP